MYIMFAVAAGGAIGSLARHYASLRLSEFHGTALPWDILTINVCGGVLMGLFAEFFALRAPQHEEWHAFFVIGILGGFTTFSSFSLDTVVLMQRGDYLLAVLYVAGSVVLSIGAVFGGMAVVRASFS